MPRPAQTAHRTVLLIGDNRFLLELVAANLARLSRAMTLYEVMAGGAAPAARPYDGDDPLSLVVLALSQSSSEPVVILAQTRLTHLIGATPLLIISDRPFVTDPARQIFHLAFPFQAQMLHTLVDNLLSAA